MELLHGLLNDACLLYQPQELSADGKTVVQHLQFALMLPFQAQMLRNFSSYLVFMDAVHNTNRKGYTVLTLMVKDEFGRGCPVAYCISSSETVSKEYYMSRIRHLSGIDISGALGVMDDTISDCRHQSRYYTSSAVQVVQVLQLAE